MNMNEQPLNLQDLIRRYNEEMLQMHARQQPSPTPQEQPAADTPAMAEPLPDFQRDLAAMAAQEVQQDVTQEVQENEPTFPYTDEDLNGQPPYPQDNPAPPAEGEQPYTGYLRVYVFSGNGAEPLPGARVAVSRREGESDTLFANVTTDQDGFTPVIPLPTVNPALSMRPDVPSPFVLYNIEVTVDGFVPATYDNVPIYGNTYVTQPAAMVPLIPGSDNPTRRFDSGGPANL